MIVLKVSDIKQYLYCPRIIYFNYVLPVERKVTRKMEYAKEEHLELDRLEKRRKLVRYRLDEGERFFHVRLQSSHLGMEGVLDMLISSPAGLYPVEFKHTIRGPELNHKYQLVAYAMLVEEHYNRPVRFGFLYLSPGKRIFSIEVTPNARIFVKRLAGMIRRIIECQQMPPRSRSQRRCRDCEFRNYCNDIW